MSSQPEDYQVHTLINRFLATKRSQETIRAYKREIEGLVEKIGLSAGRASDFFAISFSCMCKHVNEFVSEIKNIDIQTRRVTNPRSVNRRLYAISSFFKYLVRVYGYSGNPASIIELLPVPKKSSTPSLSRDETQELIVFLENYRAGGIRQFRNSLLILVLFCLALRRAEAARIRWSDINFSEGTLKVIQKGGTEKRLPIPWALLGQFRTFREFVPEQEFVFSNLRRNRGSGLTPSSVYAIVRQVIDQVVPGKGYSPHSFRKTFIEQALARKNDLISISNATGHGSIEMVKYYDTRDEIQNNAIHDMSTFLDW